MKETYRNMIALGSIAGIILITAGMVSAHVEGTYVRSEEYTSHVYMTMSEGLAFSYGESFDVLEVDITYPYKNVTVGDVVIFTTCKENNGTHCLTRGYDGGMVSVKNNYSFSAMRMNPEMTPKVTPIYERVYVGLVNQVITCVPDLQHHYGNHTTHVDGTVVVTEYPDGTATVSPDGKWVQIDTQHRYCDLSKTSVDSEKHLTWYFDLE